MIEHIRNLAIDVEGARNGGNVSYANFVYGEPKEGWVDLSTGINPKPYPFLMPPVETFSKLPDRPLKHPLIEAARHYYSSTATIVVGAGSQALLDRGWHVMARQDLQARRTRLDAMLMAAGHNVIGGTDLFRLIRTGGMRLHRQMAECGIWSRVFDFSSDILRVGLPGDESDWSRVEVALA